MKNFLITLCAKVREKEVQYPGKISSEGIGSISTFRQYDDRYTSKLHGFKDAEDYWRKSSSRQFLENVAIPTLLINAKNDPFLGEKCFPYEAAKKNPYFYLETPDDGGHVGFMTFGSAQYWHEERAVGFILEHNK
jgi:predicted alpha/beta-fold hydrolase